ncbi:non-hydrolyzing UDP-N-acetylglucosamine 2-epimerase [Oleiharenicola lentus]|uniref:non-hydrolyzing UDP-N-acetylglucosamine 2-epimerase n=1 Tax=Oleiharenicola lentus TaxID=2508720 RepID=UPI003F66F946
MRILSIIGTRPEALKMGPVIRALQQTLGLRSFVCTTGQHRELADPQLKLFGVAVDHTIHFPRRNQRPEDFLGKLLPRLGDVVRDVRPDWILAVGDTTSVLAASLIAAHHRVRFGHIEAGLRTACRTEPFPEEFNRRLTSVLADLHFAPTVQARRNLRREGISPSAILVSGNPIIDAVRTIRRQPLPPSAVRQRVWSKLGLTEAKEAHAAKLVVVTFHRRENIGRPMAEICAALRELGRLYGGKIKLLCLVHPNPSVRGPVGKALRNSPHIVLSSPLDYPSMLSILQRATLVLTDSGGLQEEAPALHVPVLVLRRFTERPEAVAAGACQLVGTDRATIIKAARRVLDHPKIHRAMAKGYHGYGDGHAATRIVHALQNYPGALCHELG